MFESIIEALKQLLTNDALFWIMQVALLYAVLRSIYIQFFKQRVNASVTKLKKAIGNRYKKTRKSIYKKLRNAYYWFRYFVRLDKRTGNVVISPDSVVLTLTAMPAKVSLHRNESSWQYFGLAWTVVSVLFIEINSTYPPLQNSEYSILVTLFNLGSITWLCFYSSWFRNHIMRAANHRNMMPN